MHTPTSVHVLVNSHNLSDNKSIEDKTTDPWAENQKHTMHPELVMMVPGCHTKVRVSIATMGSVAEDVTDWLVREEVRNVDDEVEDSHQNKAHHSSPFVAEILKNRTAFRIQVWFKS